MSNHRDKVDTLLRALDDAIEDHKTAAARHSRTLQKFKDAMNELAEALDVKVERFEDLEAEESHD